MFIEYGRIIFIAFGAIAPAVDINVCNIDFSTQRIPVHNFQHPTDREGVDYVEISREEAPAQDESSFIMVWTFLLKTGSLSQRP